MPKRQASSLINNPPGPTSRGTNANRSAELDERHSGTRRLHALNEGAEARAALRRIEQQSDFLKGRVGRWNTLLRDSFATIASDVDFDLRHRIQAVISTSEQTIGASRSTKNRDAFMAWLDERLAYETRMNYELAVSSTREFSTRAAKHFRLLETEVIDPPPPVIPSDLQATRVTAPIMPGGSRSSGRMNIFMRLYMGFVMFFLLTTFTGLKIPLYYGAAPALIMGAFAFFEDRERQIERERASMMNLTRSHISKFSIWATKDSRDLIRLMEQELRDRYSNRVGRLQRELEITTRQAEKKHSNPTTELDRTAAKAGEVQTSARPAGLTSSSDSTTPSRPSRRAVSSSQWDRLTSFHS